MVSKNLLKFAAENYSFDINTFRIESFPKFGFQTRTAYIFNKNGRDSVIKFENRSVEDIRHIRVKMDFINYLAEKNISIAAPLKTNNGEFVISTQDNGEDYIVTAFDRVSGQPWIWNEYDPNKWNDRIFFNWGKVMGDIHRAAKDYKPANEYDITNGIFQKYSCDSYNDCLKAYPAVYKAMEKLFDKVAALPKDKDSYGFTHNDMHPENFYIDGDKINVFDFGDSRYNWFASDVGIALFDALWWGRKDDKRNDLTNEIIGNFIKGYLSSNKLSDFWLSKIPMFMKYRQICCFIPWFFDPEDIDNHNGQQKEWKYSIENDILFSDCEFDKTIFYKN